MNNQVMMLMYEKFLFVVREKIFQNLLIVYLLEIFVKHMLVFVQGQILIVLMN